LLLVWQLGQSTVWANPAGGTVTQGTATFSSSGSQLTIQTSDRAAINWQSFNIGLGQTTTFVQPSSSSVVWNQINDPNPSQILGTLNANGYIILQNPSGFYIGGAATLNAHDLVMTTANMPAPNLSSGGAWQFNALPPMAKIINYGKINIDGGGSAFLIANDIENNGTISAPLGRIGLYAGQQVLVSTSPDGRGLSAQVTLPQGSVDNEGNLIADAGGISLQAKVVNQGGLIQANSVQEVNGTIELIASDDINLKSSSVISAQGDSTGASSGGSVIIKSGNNFSDQAGSAINISGGTQGGNGGQVEISALNMGAIQSSINGQATAGFINGELTIDPFDIALNSALVSSLNSLISGGLSTINLQADNNITVSASWNLADSGAAATLTLTAGNNITFNNGSAISAGNNWNVNLTAGAALSSGSTPDSGSDGIYLNGNSFIQAQNGDINLWAANEVIVNSGAIRTMNGGNISVTAEYGGVNTGNNVNGYNFAPTASVKNNVGPYYTVSSSLGGISTAAGGNVTITAGGDVTSFTPVQTINSTDYKNAKQDAGTGAFGSQPGNVTITAGGNIYGHYVLANGVGTITAGGDIGVPLSGDPSLGFALSLITGGWSIYAPNGSIYVQDVRNPNGVFNNTTSSKVRDSSGNLIPYSGDHYYDYDPNASLLLQAGNSVEFTGFEAPHTPSDNADAVPFLLPPTLSVITGSGDFVLDQDITLFPSPYGNLKLNIGGDFNGNLADILTGASSGSPATLAMSNGGITWSPGDGLTPVNLTGVYDGTTPVELNNPDPVQITVAGNINNLDITTIKAAQITVVGDINNVGFSGANLQASGVMSDTFIHAGGTIFNSPYYSTVTLASGIVSANSLDPNAWDSIFDLALDPTMLASLENFNADNPLPPGITSISQYLKVNNYLLFPNPNHNIDTIGLGANPGFVYDPSTKQLGFKGNMPASLASELEGGTFTVLVVNPNGTPAIDASGHLETKTYGFNAASSINNLYLASLDSTPTTQPGYQVGGPGLFDITASSIELGNSAGILSSGGSINVNTTGNLSMFTSTIASISGGAVTVNAGGEIDLSLGNNDFSPGNNSTPCYGIYTTGLGDVTVTAGGNVNIGSSRIASFNGGNVFVESFNGDVNAGNGANDALYVPVTPVSYSYHGQSQTSGSIGGSLISDDARPYGSGILAISPISLYKPPGGIGLPGNITVDAPNGNIVSTLGGISQFSLNNSIGGGPTITLTAGTPGVPASPAQGNILLGQGGVLGGTINLTAQGNIQGLVVSRQDANISAVQNVSATVLSGGSANVSGGGAVTGTIIGIGGATVSGGEGVTADVQSQNANVNGATSSTLGNSAAGTSAGKDAAATSNNDAQPQVASTDGDDDPNKKKKPTLQRTKRVTVILPKAS
jgi:filamentous hemagglutinin family protein